VNLNQLTFSTAGAGLRDLSWGGVNILHSVFFAVRGLKWEVLPSQDVEEVQTTTPEQFHWARREVFADNFESCLSVTAQDSGLISLEMSLTSRRAFEVNRAGFNVLFPIDDLAGRSANVLHSNGGIELGRFPELISPEQPFFDMQGIEYTVQSAKVALTFEGEVFELEDQRNWSDASFKAYCPPLADPRPRRFEAGEVICQRVTVKITGAPQKRATVKTTQPRSVWMPEILLVAGKPAPQTTLPKGARRLVRFDSDAPWTDAELGNLSGGTPIDAEIILPPDPARAEYFMRGLAQDLSDAGVEVAHVVALPSGYLKRLPPDGAVPSGLGLAAAADLAAQAFRGAGLGVGALTHFTELNRRRPSEGQGAYVTHGNAAIVHSADDQSVLETLTGLRHVMRSACAIAGDRAYRLGLVAIAMRSNPHADGLLPNPDGAQMTMTDDDPRQRTSFGAAYAVAAATLAARAGAEAICLGALDGPFSIADQNRRLHPIGHVVGQLAGLSGRNVTAAYDNGVYRLCAGTTAITANCNLTSQTLPDGISPIGTLLVGTDAAAGTHRVLPAMSCHISMHPNRPLPQNRSRADE
jgi:D-apionolactonase